jgi:hypothetical protein
MQYISNPSIGERHIHPINEGQVVIIPLNNGRFFKYDCDTGPQFSRYHPKDSPIQSPITTRLRMQMIYLNPDPHEGNYEGLGDRAITRKMTETLHHALRAMMQFSVFVSV